MNWPPFFALAVCFFVGGCRPASPPQPTITVEPEEIKTTPEPLLRTVGTIRSSLNNLQQRLRLSTAETWSREAAAAEHDLGNIRIAVGRLRADSQNVGKLESLLTDLEGKLRGASAENWNQNAPAAEQILGSIRIEFQQVSRGL